MPYHSISVKLSPAQAKRLAAGATSGQPVSLVLKETGEPQMLMLTAKQFADYESGKRRVRITPAALKKMKGSGFFSNLGQSVGKAVQRVGDELEGDESKTANDLANFAMDVGDTLDNIFTGKKGIDYTQAAKNANAARNRGKAFMAKSDAAKRSEWMKVPKSFRGSFEDYSAKMAGLAEMPAATAKSVKTSRRSRLRGDGRTPAGKITGRPAAPKGGAKLGEMAAEFIRNALDEGN